MKPNILRSNSTVPGTVQKKPGFFRRFINQDRVLSVLSSAEHHAGRLTGIPKNVPGRIRGVVRPKKSINGRPVGVLPIKVSKVGEKQPISRKPVLKSARILRK